MNADTYRDAFLKFIADGMSYAEAKAQFDEVEWRKALISEIDSGVTVNRTTGDIECDGKPSLLALGARADAEARSIRDMETQGLALYAAGWTSEVPDSYKHNSKAFWRQCPTMSLYWRAPSKRPGKPGRKYLSTNQAYNAMMKAAKH